MTKASGKASARAEQPIGTRQRSSRGDASTSGEDRIVGAGVGVSRAGGAGSIDRIRTTIRDNAEGKSTGDHPRRPSSSGNGEDDASVSGGSRKVCAVLYIDIAHGVKQLVGALALLPEERGYSFVHHELCRCR